MLTELLYVVKVFTL